MNTVEGKVLRGPNDPARRQRIIEAAAQVVAEHGVEALTFRGVAKVAQVPLGSTTYYFADKDELLVSTIRAIRERNEKYYQRLLDPLVRDHGVVGGISALNEEVTVRQRPNLVLEYGLYLSTLHRPALRPEVEQWRFESTVDPYCTPEIVKILGFTLEGILLQSVMEGTMFFSSDVEPIVRRIIDGP